MSTIDIDYSKLTDRNFCHYHKLMSDAGKENQFLSTKEWIEWLQANEHEKLLKSGGFYVVGGDFMGGVITHDLSHTLIRTREAVQ